MKNKIIQFTLALIILGCINCSDDQNVRPSQILVTVTGECVCNVFIYTTEGLCLQSKIWDCQETGVLVFDIYHEGTIRVIGEYKSKRTETQCTLYSGRTTEAALMFSSITTQTKNPP